MSSSRNMLLLLLLVASAAVQPLEAKTVFRRTDKISENFKQLDLPPEEIDPNVAPPESEPPKVDDVADEVVADAVTAASLLDESANEIASGDVETPNAVASIPEAPAAAPEAAAAAAPAVATTLAAKPTVAPTTAKPENPISKFCKCTESHCDCCRKIGLPLLPSGPGCAKIAFLGNDEMNVSLKYGDITLASRRISSKRARPICVGLPGGETQFCGKVYGLSRAKDSKDFKACLAFELRSDDEVEASLRVSCFKFGPEGLRVVAPEPLPADDDDDDDDLFGFAAGGDDDEDDEDDYDSDTDADTDDDDDTEDYADDDEAEAPEDADYGGFSLAGLLDELDDDEDEKPVKKPAVAAAADQTREHVSVDGQETSSSTNTDLVQSKDDSEAPAAGEAPAAAAVLAPAEGDVSAAVVTPAPASAADDSTTPKSKKSKKTKKNKKKKAAAEATDETGFAYELLNGILDFFN
ncbi:germ cell nuclear acidic protein [Drosophila biarmipes]|uniref:germ cell nuclear acidic protein n=1 Tax=Drosophila biarmipes TaxID=125945 RepID=UPI0007E78402|nr:germ cell nuclear acidic protein [Drosophila biarmipes]